MSNPWYAHNVVFVERTTAHADFPGSDNDMEEAFDEVKQGLDDASNYTLAEDYANADPGAPVSGSTYSAKKYATDAATSKTNTESSETTAASNESDASVALAAAISAQEEIEDTVLPGVPEETQGLVYERFAAYSAAIPSSAWNSDSVLTGATTYSVSGGGGSVLLVGNAAAKIAVSSSNGMFWAAATHTLAGEVTAFGYDGSLWWAAAITGAGAPHIQTSSNGSTFSDDEAPYADGRIVGIACNDSYAAIVTTGSAKTAHWRAAAGSWSDLVLPDSIVPAAIAVNSAGDVWVAVGAGAKISVCSQAEPSSWLAATTVPGVADVAGVAWNDSLSKFIAVTDDGEVLVSADGDTWTLEYSNADLVFIGVAVDIYGSIWAVDETGIIVISSDGQTYMIANSALKVVSSPSSVSSNDYAVVISPTAPASVKCQIHPTLN